MSATQFIPTRRVRFQHEGGWRQGEVCHERQDWKLIKPGDLNSIEWFTVYRVRDLTGKYYDVPAAECEEDGKRNDKGELELVADA